jgi:hypothetical protein
MTSAFVSQNWLGKIILFLLFKQIAIFFPDTYFWLFTSGRLFDEQTTFRGLMEMKSNHLG